MTALRHNGVWGPALLLSALLVVACEPASITEARNQLRRGGARTTSYSVPVARDTFTLADFLPETDTTTTGSLVGVRLDPESVSVNVGTKLQFSNVQMDSVKVSFPGAALAFPAGTQVPFTVSQNVLQSEARLQAVDTITALSGSIAITVANRLPHGAAFTLALRGFLTAGGAQLSQSGTVSARTQNDGTYNSTTVNFNLANVRIVPDSNVVLSGTITLTGTVANPVTLTDAIVLSGTGSMVVERLAGPLNPAVTLELDTIPIENFQETPNAIADFGDFKDAILASVLNNATADLTVINGANVPVQLTNFRIGLAELTASGQLPRDGSGNIVFEKDGSGNDIFLSIVDGAGPTYSVARNATKTSSFPAAALLDRLVNRLLNNRRMGVVAVARARLGDGAFSAINRTDIVRVRFQLTVGLDLTLPPAGVGFQRKQIAGGLDLEQSDSDELSTRLDRATLSASVTNGTPFGVTALVSIVRDSVALSVSGILGLPICTGAPTSACRVSLVSIVVPPSAVSASGQVVTPANGNVEVTLSGNTASVLFGKRFTTAITFQLVPGTGGSGRAAIRPADRLSLNARATVVVKAGGG
jgi:hypothetical protein